MAGKGVAAARGERAPTRPFQLSGEQLMIHSTAMTDADDRDAVVLPPLTPALLLNKAALLDALGGICSLAVVFKVDDFGSTS